MQYAKSKDTNEPVHLCCLISAFFVCQYFYFFTISVDLLCLYGLSLYKLFIITPPSSQYDLNRRLCQQC